jgi:hypothetical protein
MLPRGFYGRHQGRFVHVTQAAWQCQGSTKPGADMSQLDFCQLSLTSLAKKKKEKKEWASCMSDLSARDRLQRITKAPERQLPLFSNTMVRICQGQH